MPRARCRRRPVLRPEGKGSRLQTSGRSPERTWRPAWLGECPRFLVLVDGGCHAPVPAIERNLHEIRTHYREHFGQSLQCIGEATCVKEGGTNVQGQDTGVRQRTFERPIERRLI